MFDKNIFAGARRRDGALGLRFRKPPVYPPELWGRSLALVSEHLVGRQVRSSIDDERLDGRGKALPPLEEGELHHEDERAHRPLLLLHQLPGAPSRPPGAAEAVAHRDFLARPSADARPLRPPPPL